MHTLGIISGPHCDHSSRAEYQGLGIGPRLSDATGSRLIARGVRYISRTAHPRFGGYREASALWEATTTNMTAQTHEAIHNEKDRKRRIAEFGTQHQAVNKARLSYSHEYCGTPEERQRAALHRANAPPPPAQEEGPPFPRPAGRAPRGKTWDAANGVWVAKTPTDAEADNEEEQAAAAGTSASMQPPGKKAKAAPAPSPARQEAGGPESAGKRPGSAAAPPPAKQQKGLAAFFGKAP